MTGFARELPDLSPVKAIIKVGTTQGKWGVFYQTLAIAKQAPGRYTRKQTDSTLFRNGTGVGFFVRRDDRRADRRDDD